MCSSDLEELGIKRELKDRGGFRLFGEFAVVGLVRPIAEAARFSVNLAKDIGAAEKAAVEKSALGDRCNAGFHGAACFVEDALLVHAAEIDEIALADFLFEELEVFGFVAFAELAKDFGVWVGEVWLVALTTGDGDVQFSQVAAREMVAHVRRSQPDRATLQQFHNGSLPDWWRLGEQGRKRRKGVYPPGVFARVGKLFRVSELSGF